MVNIFLTGDIQVGKTTLLNKVIDNIDSSIGGFQTNRTIKENGDMYEKEFFIYSLIDKNITYKIATINKHNDKFKPTVYNDAFEKVSDNIIKESLNCCDVIVLDELGFLESNAFNFQHSVFKALDSEKLVLGIIKPRSTPFLDKIKSRNDVILFEVNTENRDFLLNEIISTIKKYFPNI